MNAKVYTLNDVKEIFDIAKDEYTDGWWGLVVPQYVHDQMLAEIPTVPQSKMSEADKLILSVCVINIIINDDIVQYNGGHCMFVDEELGKTILNMQAMPYELYEMFIKDIR